MDTEANPVSAPVSPDLWPVEYDIYFTEFCIGSGFRVQMQSQVFGYGALSYKIITETDPFPLFCWTQGGIGGGGGL